MLGATLWRLEATLWRLGATLWAGLTRRLLLIALGAALIGLGLYWGVPYAWQVLFPSDGQIIVNSPTVYTRQRLVNDRLSQAAWLQQQLKAADAPEDQFRSVDQVQHTVQARKINAGLGVGSPSESLLGSQETKKTQQNERSQEIENAKQNKKARQNETDQQIEGGNDTPLAGVQPTTAALFRAKDAYRDEVRSEMMETQLDDRHDILGNTIYRLSFDAAVVPGTRTDDVAFIRVKLAHRRQNRIAAKNPGNLENSDNPESKLLQKIYSKSELELLGKLYSDDDAQFYNDWKRSVAEKTIPKIFDDMVVTILKRAPVPSPMMPLSDFLTGRICELMQRKNINLDPGIDDSCDPSQQSASPQYLDAASSLINAYAAEYVQQDIEAVKRSIDKEVKLLGQEPSDAVMGIIRANCSNPRAGVPPEAIRSPEAPPLPTPLPVSVIDCPASDTATERLLMGTVLYHELYNYVAGGGDPPPKVGDTPPKAEDWIAAIKPKHQTDKDKPQAQADGGLFDEALKALQGAAVRCFAADYLRNKFDAFKEVKSETPDPEQMDTFLTLKITGRNVNDCHLSVVSHVDKKYGRSDMDNAINNLMYFLDKDTEMFAYSVTPRSLSQYVSSSSDIRDAYQMLLQLNAGGILRQQDASSLINWFTERSKNVKGIVEHPVVVGFGSDDAQPVLIESNDRKESAPTIRTTSFGWAILPGLDDDGNSRQKDNQYTLTAVVSVPSWWRSAELDIETCWFPRSELYHAVRGGVAGFDVCPRTTQKPLTVIHLPGSYQDVASKLGISVLEEPHIYNTEDDHQTLEIYTAGSLLLTGERLWRSTEVTVGTQLADSIIVLPNMQGIIATFYCVLPQPGNLNPDGFGSGGYFIGGVPVQVWTSEGVTEIKQISLYRRASRADEQTAQQQSMDSATNKASPSGANTPAGNQIILEPEEVEHPKREKCFKQSSRVPQLDLPSSR
jgi:hypothetical protein